MNNFTPVTILNSSVHSSVAIARSLGRLGIPIYCAASDLKDPSSYSRYYKQKFIWSGETQEAIKGLLNIGEKIGKQSILMPTTDEDVLLLCDHADQLEKYFIFPHLSAKLVRDLASKKDMFYLAKNNDIPTAEAAFPQSRRELQEYLHYAKFPIMVKGIYGNLLKQACGKKMFIAKSTEEVLQLYDQYENVNSPNIMLQEYIPGREDSIWMYNGYFNEKSECLFKVTGKKIRQAPPYTGATSLGICLRNDEVAHLTEDFMKKIGYTGVLDIGYRYDKRDGKYKVLDINPRIGCTFRLFVGEAGLDVVRAQYLDLTGQNVPCDQIIEGRKWFVENWDFASSVGYIRDKNLTFKQWINSYRGVKEVAWFAFDDINPFARMSIDFGKKIVTRLTQKLATRI